MENLVIKYLILINWISLQIIKINKIKNNQFKLNLNNEKFRKKDGLLKFKIY